MNRLRRAINETKEHMNLNYDRQSDDDDGSGYTDDDAMDELLGECGQQSDGTCLYAGSEQCDWDCPFS